MFFVSMPREPSTHEFSDSMFSVPYVSGVVRQIDPVLTRFDAFEGAYVVVY